MMGSYKVCFCIEFLLQVYPALFCFFYFFLGHLVVFTDGCDNLGPVFCGAGFYILWLNFLQTQRILIRKFFGGAEANGYCAHYRGKYWRQKNKSEKNLLIRKFSEGKVSGTLCLDFHHALTDHDFVSPWLASWPQFFLRPGLLGFVWLGFL